MTPEQFANLRHGDIVQGIATGLGYTVESNLGKKVIVARVVEAINPDEWTLIQKAPNIEQFDLSSLDLPSLESQKLPEPKPTAEPPSPEDLMENDDAIEAVEQCDRILEECEEVPEAGEDFAASVMEKIESIRETIVRLDRVTPGQQNALDNMERGVSRWTDRQFD